jgi:hypothetical protein
MPAAAWPGPADKYLKWPASTVTVRPAVLPGPTWAAFFPAMVKPWGSLPCGALRLLSEAERRNQRVRRPSSQIVDATTSSERDSGGPSEIVYVTVKVPLNVLTFGPKER